MTGSVLSPNLESRSALHRARLFLRLADRCTANEREEFEAFSEAAIVFARAALLRFKKRVEKHQRFKAWWSALEENQAIQFFWVERGWILKEASARLGQRGFAASVGKSSPAYVPTLASEFYFLEGPHTCALGTIEKHLMEIERIMEEAEREFSQMRHV